MDKMKLKSLSKEQLKEKEKSLKVIMGIFIPIIIMLFYFVIRDSFNGEEVDWSILTIAICTIGGPVTLYPELKQVQEELGTRD